MTIKITHKIVSILLLSSVLVSCKKDNVIVEDNSTTNAFSTVDIKEDRLTFSDGKAFGNFMLSINTKEESPKVFAALKQKGFSSAREVRISKVTLGAHSNSSPLMTTNKGKQSTSNQPASNQQLVSEEKGLVEDPLIEEMLNENMEVEIQGIIYKVTPYGTFVVTRDHYPQLIKILEEHKALNEDLKNSTLYSKSTGDNLYEIGEEIYLYDTFAIKNPEAQLRGFPPVREEGEGSGGLGPTTPNYSAQIENRDYSSLPLINFGAKTIVGKWLEEVLGRNEVFEGEFSDDRRVKVSLHNTNFVFIKSLGIKVEFQKKNWIGWSGTNCEQLRLGWEGIEFKKKNNAPIEPQTILGTPVDFSGNPDWDTTLPPWVKPPSTYVQFDLLDYKIKINKTKSFQEGVKELYDLAKEKLGSKPTLNDKSKVIAWGDEARTQVTFIGGPEEEVRYNVEEIDRNFARVVDVIVSVPSSSSYSAILKAVIATFSASNKADQIELVGASIYGVAKCDGKWLGARIDKND